MNTIEMQSITAVAHLRSAVCFFMDLSEQCGYPVAAQIQLFQSIKPLFSNKLTFIIINKIDITKPEDLDQETQAQLQSLLNSGEVELLQVSCTTSEGVMDVRNAVCDRLLASRNAQKLASGTNATGEPTGRLGDLLRRIHVAQPLGGVTREAYIPEAAVSRMRFEKDDPNRPRLERDLEEENGGAGVYSVDVKKSYLEMEDDQKHDRMPEFFNGKNVADFIDPDIAQKLASLEAEEEKLEATGFYQENEEDETIEEAETHYKAELIREKRQLIRNEAKQRKSLKNRAMMPRSATTKNLSTMKSHLQSLGHDTYNVSRHARSKSRGRSSIRGRSDDMDDENAMDVDSGAGAASSQKALLARSKSRARSQSNRRDDGVTDERARSQAEKLQKLGQKKMNRMARQGEADRHQTAALPKHLVSHPYRHSIYAGLVVLTIYLCSSLGSAGLERPSDDETREMRRSGGHIFLHVHLTRKCLRNERVHGHIT